MARKAKPRAAEPPADFKEDLTAALHKIGETELRALIFGYLHAKEQSSIQASLIPKDDAFPNVFKAAIQADPSFASHVPASLPAPDSVFLRDDIQTHARNPFRDIVGCIEAVFNRNGKPFARTLKPSDVIRDYRQWTDLAQEIYLCVARKYPKFAPYAKPSTAEKFFDVSLDVFAQAIHEVAV